MMDVPMPPLDEYSMPIKLDCILRRLVWLGAPKVARLNRIGNQYVHDRSVSFQPLYLKSIISTYT